MLESAPVGSVNCCRSIGGRGGWHDWLGGACRLIVGAYDQVGHQLLGSTCSAPIRVLANNDVPSGAAFISLQLPIRADWDGWLPHNMKVPNLRCFPALALQQYATRSRIKKK